MKGHTSARSRLALAAELPRTLRWPAEPTPGSMFGAQMRFERLVVQLDRVADALLSVRESQWGIRPELTALLVRHGHIDDVVARPRPLPYDGRLQVARLYAEAGCTGDALREWQAAAAEGYGETAVAEIAVLLDCDGQHADAHRLPRWGLDPDGSVAAMWAVPPPLAAGAADA